MAGAPYPFVNPNCLSLTAETGTHFDVPASSADANASIVLPRSPPFTPFLAPHQPPRSTYGPFRHQYRNPTFAPLRPASPRHSTLNPTARSFTLPQQGPSRPVVETRHEQDAGRNAAAISPRTPVTPCIQLSPADDVIADGGLAAVQAARQSSRTRCNSSPCRRPVGIQRRPSNASRRLPVRTGIPPPTPTPMRPPVPQFPPQQPVNNSESVSGWLDGTYAVLLNGQPRIPVIGAQGPETTSNTLGPFRPGIARSTTNTTASTAVTTATSASRSGSYFCIDPSCTTPRKPYLTPSALDKHARKHLPESSRPYACHAQDCPRRFWWPKDRKRHEARKHNGASVRCGICGNHLSRGDNLDRHVVTVHRDSRVQQSMPLSPAASMRTATTEYAESSAAAQTPRSEVDFSLTVPSSPPSIGTQYSPYASGLRAGMPRHLSFASAQRPPPVSRGLYATWSSQPMEKSQSSGW